MNDRQRLWLQQLPKIDELMLLLAGRENAARLPKPLLRELCRAEVERRRRDILAWKEGGAALEPPSPAGLAGVIDRKIGEFYKCRLRRVVNATGVILHTNLGRAPLSPAALARLIEVSRGYSNLEFDLEKGSRGLRYDHVRELLCLLTGAEDALVVNNNAAAVLLVLDSLARGGEAVVSRGELIEIGGEFRIPEVMEKGGVRLREVGATNRTRLDDYRQAVNPETRLLMKVHTSNYKLIGFTEDVPLRDLVALGRELDLPVLNDLGSGCFIDLAAYGRQREPTVGEVTAAGADVVTFSGDKLLGGPQAGIILGKGVLLERVKKNPLNRALRIDKLTLAALEGTLIAYLDPERAVKELRVLGALTEPREEVRKRARKLLRRLRAARMPGVVFSIREGSSAAGGGALPGQDIPTFLVSLRADRLSASRLEERLRGLDIPVIARIEAEEVLFDMRTVAEEEFPFILEGLQSIFS
ncbi:MAG TPA: L-seryl-tRNA(Sec) selenium transferase [Syntrophales bacterium]|mgnify:FL=1|jgi:L-seryl-tRNA(Ser) seleniumtransferase|nr:L-seryl-tRNA(Sec) selenium transferase [Syntrophales bacterium]HPC32971.1 L-seryl-tRNA(Sec) selenium transferase [Syntrophales bacterium]HQI36115.1 L-seryl-tRNA(Sec) selenium transferase [Syntrophales bacterium]HQJ30004.1 L-seryl-tRNA(Sec) selenium transferase [Syntrophales bacterium]HRU89072.1 L-seryl-tRNA(Sec) selenium transferase [Syntrophales bacterium]